MYPVFVRAENLHAYGMLATPLLFAGFCRGRMVAFVPFSLCPVADMPQFKHLSFKNESCESCFVKILLLDVYTVTDKRGRRKRCHVGVISDSLPTKLN